MLISYRKYSSSESVQFNINYVHPFHKFVVQNKKSVLEIQYFILKVKFRIYTYNFIKVLCDCEVFC